MLNTGFSLCNVLTLGFEKAIIRE